MSLGGNSQKSSSSATSDKLGVSQSQSYLDPAQAAAQQTNIQGFNQALGNYDQTAAAQQGQGFVNQASALAAKPGTSGQFGLGVFAQQQNPYLQSQINQFGGDMSRQFGRQLQQIGGGYQGAGQRGSSRQGIAEGLAAESAQRQYQQGVTGMRSAAYNQQQQAMTDLGQQQLQARQLQNQSIQTGMDALATNTANQFQPFAIGSQVIGSPSTLNSAQSLEIARSRADSSGSGAGFNIGFGS